MFSLKRHPSLIGAAFVVLLAAINTPAQAQAQARAFREPFAGLSGDWSGIGTVSLSSGTRERIRCRASYAVGGQGQRLQQNLRCASDSYRFDVVSDVVSEGGRLRGTWNETTRGVRGAVSGSVSRGEVRALISADNFSAGFSLNTRGNQQSVEIRPSGADVTAVSVVFRRN